MITPSGSFGSSWSGAATTTTFKITDHNGQPVKTELGFTAYDEALTQLLDTAGRIASPTFLQTAKTVDVKRAAIGGEDYLSRFHGPPA
jgi:hypothetical protein